MVDITVQEHSKKISPADVAAQALMLIPQAEVWEKQLDELNAGLKVQGKTLKKNAKTRDSVIYNNAVLRLTRELVAAHGLSVLQAAVRPPDDPNQFGYGVYSQNSDDFGQATEVKRGLSWPMMAATLECLSRKPGAKGGVAILNPTIAGLKRGRKGYNIEALSWSYIDCDIPYYDPTPMRAGFEALGVPAIFGESSSSTTRRVDGDDRIYKHHWTFPLATPLRNPYVTKRAIKEPPKGYNEWKEEIQHRLTHITSVLSALGGFENVHALAGYDMATTRITQPKYIAMRPPGTDIYPLFDVLPGENALDVDKLLELTGYISWAEWKKIVSGHRRAQRSRGVTKKSQVSAAGTNRVREHTTGGVRTVVFQGSILDDIKARISPQDYFNSIAGLPPDRCPEPGKNSICPFHGSGNNTAQFSVYESHGIWRYKCHSPECDANGSVLDAHMHFTGLSIKEAARDLAEKVGIDLSLYRPRAILDDGIRRSAQVDDSSLAAPLDMVAWRARYQRACDWEAALSRMRREMQLWDEHQRTINIECIDPYHRKWTPLGEKGKIRPDWLSSLALWFKRELGHESGVVQEQILRWIFQLMACYKDDYGWLELVPGDVHPAIEKIGMAVLMARLPVFEPPLPNYDNDPYASDEDISLATAEALADHSWPHIVGAIADAWHHYDALVRCYETDREAWQSGYGRKKEPKHPSNWIRRELNKRLRKDQIDSLVTALDNDFSRLYIAHKEVADFQGFYRNFVVTDRNGWIRARQRWIYEKAETLGDEEFRDYLLAGASCGTLRQELELLNASHFSPEERILERRQLLCKHKFFCMFCNESEFMQAARKALPAWKYRSDFQKQTAAQTTDKYAAEAERAKSEFVIAEAHIDPQDFDLFKKHMGRTAEIPFNAIGFYGWDTTLNKMTFTMLTDGKHAASSCKLRNATRKVFGHSALKEWKAPSAEAAMGHLYRRRMGLAAKTVSLIQADDSNGFLKIMDIVRSRRLFSRGQDRVGGTPWTWPKKSDLEEERKAELAEKESPLDKFKGCEARWNLIFAPTNKVVASTEVGYLGDKDFRPWSMKKASVTVYKLARTTLAVCGKAFWMASENELRAQLAADRLQQQADAQAPPESGRAAG